MVSKSPIFFVLFWSLHTTVYGLYEFESLTQSPYYIDKTYFLSTLFFELKIPNNFITCPRRFGKTSMLLMIEHFAQVEIDKHRHPTNWTSSKAYTTFENLNVAQIKPMMANHLARYPVIQLNLGFGSMKDFNGTNLLVHLNQQLEKCFDKFRWLCKCRYSGNSSLPFKPYSNISQDDYVFIKSALNMTLDNTGISNSLLELCRILYSYFHKTPVIVLVDDYDSAAINAMIAPSVNLTEYYDLVNAMLSRAFLDGQKYIKFSLVTANSAINFYKDQPTHFATVSHRPFLSKHQFTPFCGFLETEVKAMYRKFRLSKQQKYDVQNYYNGYFTSSLTDPQLIYNPFGLTRYLMYERELKKFTLPSQHSEIISKLFIFKQFRQDIFRPAWSKTTDRCNFTLKKTYETDDMDKMLYLLRTDHNYLTQERIDQDKEEYIRISHSFAFEQGYFTYSFSERNFFKIPNQQVRLEIKEMMTVYFKAPPDREF